MLEASRGKTCERTNERLGRHADYMYGDMHTR